MCCRDEVKRPTQCVSARREEEEEESADVGLAGRLSEAEEKIKVLHSCKWFKRWHVL